MEELNGIMEANIGLLQANAIFAIGNIILLWMVFRGVTNAYIYGTTTFGRVVHSIMSVCIVLFNLGVFANVTSQLNNWAYSISQLEGEIPGGQQLFVDRRGATEYVDPSLIPSNPVALIFWVTVLVGLIGGMWTAPGPKEETA